MNAHQTHVSMAAHASTDLVDISVAVQLDLLDIIVTDVRAFWDLFFYTSIVLKDNQRTIVGVVCVGVGWN